MQIKLLTSKRYHIVHLNMCHDDVINGNIFRVTGHLCGEFTGPGEFPTQRPETRSFDVFFDLFSKQSWGWWFETQSRPLWRHCNWYMVRLLCASLEKWLHCKRFEHSYQKTFSSQPNAMAIFMLMILNLASEVLIGWQGSRHPFKMMLETPYYPTWIFTWMFSM